MSLINLKEIFFSFSFPPFLLSFLVSHSPGRMTETLKQLNYSTDESGGGGFKGSKVHSVWVILSPSPNCDLCANDPVSIHTCTTGLGASLQLMHPICKQPLNAFSVPTLSQHSRRVHMGRR